MVGRRALLHKFEKNHGCFRELCLRTFLTQKYDPRHYLSGWLALSYRPSPCRLNQLYAGKTGTATSNLSVLLLVAVPVAGMEMY